MKQFNSKNLFSSVLVKFAVCFLLLGISYRLFSSSFVLFSPLAISDDDAAALSVASTQPPLPPRQTAEPPELIDDPLVNIEYSSHNESCDLFNGDWIPDSDGPFYTNSTCRTIEAPQNCMKNGRPDSGYLYWRWKPKGCSLPKLDAKKFLEIMRDRSLAFIGDSIMRNHVQSLLCILSQFEQAVDVYHDEPYKNRRWSFPSHNFTVSIVWAPFLTKAFTFEDDDGVASDIIQLYVDEPDTIWTDQYEDFDYVVIGGGKWFLKAAIYYENKTILGCHNCRDSNITEVGFEHAYRRALNSTLKFVSEVKHRPYILFRTTTPDHFENGEWDSGGYCNRTKPFREDEIEIRDIDEMMRRVELEEFEWAAEEAVTRNGGSSFELLDTTMLSLLRPDGHPGVYRQFQPYEGKEKDAKIQNDCLHWCLPGPIDSWNDLMMEMLLRYQR